MWHQTTTWFGQQVDEFKRFTKANNKGQDTMLDRDVYDSKRDNINTQPSHTEEAARQRYLKDTYLVTSKLAGKFQQTHKPMKNKNRNILTTTENQRK